MSLITALVVGGVSGWLAGIIMKSDHSVIVNIIIGLAGGAFGGWLGKKVGIGPDGIVGSIAISVVGACILIALFRLIF